MSAKELRGELKSLITQAIDKNLTDIENRLREIDHWLKKTKDGKVTANQFLFGLLRELVIDTTILISLADFSGEEQTALLEQEFLPTERYWYQILFPRWFSQADPKFGIWGRKLKMGEFNQNDIKIIRRIRHQVGNRQGTVSTRLIADLAMATDLIISSSQGKPLCVQLTTVAEEHASNKVRNWEETLRYWHIERGLFLSYNPSRAGYLDQLIKIIISNSENLPSGTYQILYL